MDRLFITNLEDREALFKGASAPQNVKDVPPMDDFEIAGAAQV